MKLNNCVLVLLIVVTAVSLFAGCGKSDKSVSNATSEDNNMVGLANPWREINPEDMSKEIGFTLVVPEGATDVVCSIMDSEGLGQLSFKLDNQEYTARIKSVSSFEDISGMYYDWTNEEDIKINWCEGKEYRYIGENEQAALCMWCDIVPGVMYSVSATGSDLNGLDLTVIANMVYTPMQDDAP